MEIVSQLIGAAVGLIVGCGLLFAIAEIRLRSSRRKHRRQMQEKWDAQMRLIELMYPRPSKIPHCACGSHELPNDVPVECDDMVHRRFLCAPHDLKKVKLWRFVGNAPEADHMELERPGGRGR